MRFQFEGDERSALIARFGLAANASDPDIGQAVQNHLLTAESGGGDPPSAGDPGESTTPPTTPPTSPGGDPGSQGTGANGPAEPPPSEEDDDALEGQIVLDPEAYKSLTARAAQAAKLEEDARIARRDTLIADAVKVGKFPPSRKTHYATLFDGDAEGTERMIKRLQPGVVPMEARGSAPVDDEIESDAYPTDWLPENNRRTAASNGTAQPGRRNRVMTED
jgi:hypothetical protein